MLKRIEDDKLPVRAAGGDNEVPRDHMTRPRIVVPCVKCDGVGKVPSEKVEGRMNKCPGNCGPQKGDDDSEMLKPGQKLAPYTRTTTYIDCIEDKSNLMAWKGRMALIGVAVEPDLLNRVDEHWDVLQTSKDKDEIRKAKDWLTRRSETAQDKAGASDKANKGTELHGYSELVDQGIDLPDSLTFEDSIDMMAYREATWPLVNIVHMERLMVLDEFKVAGTPDRVSTVKEGVTLVAPDGHVFSPDELIITDLKTGTVEYGQLKMAMQLSIYSRSKLYDWRTGERSEIKNLNQDWGIIMNVPAGTGECELLWADLRMGWRAVRIAREIRQLRNEGKRALSRLAYVDASAQNVTQSV